MQTQNINLTNEWQVVVNNESDDFIIQSATSSDATFAYSDEQPTIEQGFVLYAGKAITRNVNGKLWMRKINKNTDTEITVAS